MRRFKPLTIWLPALLAGFGYLGTSSRLAAQAPPPAFDVRANYVKSAHTVPMRDGVKLFTVVYSPKDSSQKYPVMLSRTPDSVAPYGPAALKSAIGPSEAMAREGYIFVYQDVRGRWMSEGEF